MQPRSDITPHQLGQRTAKKDMVSVLLHRAELTSSRARAVPFSNLVCRGQPTPSGLLEKDLDLGRDLGSPNEFELRSGGTRNNPGIQRLNRKLFGRSMMLGNITCNFKKNPTLTQDISRRYIAMREGECIYVPS